MVSALTSTLVMSQSLTALLWTPLVTIWKPLAVAVWSSTGDRSGEGQPGGSLARVSIPVTLIPRTLGFQSTQSYVQN